MALSAEDLQSIQTMIDAALSTARVPARAPRAPDDLIYEGNGTYWSPGTKHGYSKGAGGILIDTGAQEVGGDT